MDVGGGVSPVWSLIEVYDEGEGQCVESGSTVFSDNKVLFTLDQQAIGGAQNGGSRERGATRMVVVGPEKD